VTGTNAQGQQTTGQTVGVVTVMVTAGGPQATDTPTYSTQPGGKSSLWAEIVRLS